MSLLSTPSCPCAACARFDPSPVCGHLGLSGWCCVYCGGPAVNLSGLPAVLRHTVRLRVEVFAFECSLGALSRWGWVRTLHRAWRVAS